MTTTFNRATFTTKRAMEFFSEKELQMQIGHARPYWPIVLVKELIDNALDACEQAGTAPTITVTVEPDAVAVQDNGPGLPLATLKQSLDYMVRVSDKSHYVSPTRGQLGNALKCIWAAPFVINGDHGCVEVVTGGTVHTIDVRLDRIKQEPVITHHTAPDGAVKSGTRVKMYLPQIASYQSFYGVPSFYKILFGYALVNPHATFMLNHEGEITQFEAIMSTWSKWNPNAPTSPHWYTSEQLEALISAYLADEQAGGRARTVREFVAEFNGLSGSAKQKAVLEYADMPGLYLHDLIDGRGLSISMIDRLLCGMKHYARTVKPTALGVIGKDQVLQCLTEHLCIDHRSVQYTKVEGMDGSAPFVLEVAFGVYRAEYRSTGRRAVLVGLNWTPAIELPFFQLSNLFGQQRVDAHDPVVMAIHLTHPRLQYIDRGKTKIALSPLLDDTFSKCITSVTKKWKAEKRQADKADRVRSEQIERMLEAQTSTALSIKEAAYHVMEQAYLKVSNNKQYPANARQIMYAARPLVMQLTANNQCWTKSSYFTQHLLPNFIEAHPELTADWDVVYDARGKFIEPHTGTRTDLGTIDVRRYIHQWHADGEHDDVLDLDIRYRCATHGPHYRYRFALFIEKEGFDSILQRAQIAERYDVAIMSTKGMSVTAARMLIERLSDEGVTFLVAHDFDKSGFTIAHTLQNDTRRYSFQAKPTVIDLGLRLEDVNDMQLESEHVDYDSKVDPRHKLREHGATHAECDFLVRGRSGGGWYGERVELNAMTSPQFIAWLECKFDEYGVQKVVPDDDALAQAYRSAWRHVLIQETIDRIIKDVQQIDIAVPDDVQETIQREIEGTAFAWDAALWDLVCRTHAAD